MAMNDFPSKLYDLSRNLIYLILHIINNASTNIVAIYLPIIFLPYIQISGCCDQDKAIFKRVETQNCRMMMLMGWMHKNFHPQKMINGSHKRCNQIMSHKYQQAIYRKTLYFSSEGNLCCSLSLIVFQSSCNRFNYKE